MYKNHNKEGEQNMETHCHLNFLQLLAERIRQNIEIRGVYIDEEHKIASYADDIISYLTNVHTSLPALLGGVYSTLSGYKLSSNKTEVMQIGCQLESQFKKKFKFKWDQNNVR